MDVLLFHGKKKRGVEGQEKRMKKRLPPTTLNNRSKVVGVCWAFFFSLHRTTADGGEASNFIGSNEIDRWSGAFADSCGDGRDDKV